MRLLSGLSNKLKAGVSCPDQQHLPLVEVETADATACDEDAKIATTRPLWTSYHIYVTSQVSKSTWPSS